MGKARNLALATSIAAVQEGKSLFFFLSKVFHYELAKRHLLKELLKAQLVYAVANTQ